METYTPVEYMLIAAARRIRNGEVVFVGTYWPLVVATLAKKTCAPDATWVFEAGLICDSLPGAVPLLTTDPRLVRMASLCGDCYDSLAALQGGHITTALLSASSVDKYGNINTTCIGDYLHPTVRLAGTGGACDIMSLARNVMIILEQDVKRFPEKVDYITGPGYLNGGDSRERAGLRPATGPSLVVSSAGVFGFDPRTREMCLAECFAGIEADDIAAGVGWDLKVAAPLGRVPPPTGEELRILREEVDPERIFLR